MATKVNDSNSITAEPDRAWVAERQDAITAALERRNEDFKDSENGGDKELEGKPGQPREADHHQRGGQDETTVSEEKLSGESPRIGTGNWDDEEVPFGEHVGFL